MRSHLLENIVGLCWRRWEANQGRQVPAMSPPLSMSEKQQMASPGSTKAHPCNGILWPLLLPVPQSLEGFWQKSLMTLGCNPAPLQSQAFQPLLHGNLHLTRLLGDWSAVKQHPVTVQPVRGPQKSAPIVLRKKLQEKGRFDLPPWLL